MPHVREFDYLKTIITRKMDIHYIHIEGKTNFSTMLYNKTFANVVKVDVCYAELTGKENEPIILDIQELRTQFTENGRDIQEERTLPVSQGFFFTLPGRDALRIFKENTDFVYGINYSPPINFNRLTLRIIDKDGKPNVNDRHVVMLRVHCLKSVAPERPQARPQRPPQPVRQRPIYLVQD